MKYETKLIKSEYVPVACEFWRTFSGGEELKWLHTSEEYNSKVLNTFYGVLENWFFKQNFDDIHENFSDTINPAKKHAFSPLREYRVIKNGHTKMIRFYNTFWGEIAVTESKF